MRIKLNWSRYIAAVSFITLALAVLPLSSAFAKGDPDFDPPLAPLPAHPGIPVDNPSSTNVFPAPMGPKQELGYLLWFDSKLTGDASLSCGTCHHPDFGWGFNDPISRGYPGTVHWRNSQSIVNTGYFHKLFWAGSVPSLEAQAPAANKGGVAGNGEDDMMESRLHMTPEYRKRWRETFGGSPKIKDAWRAVSAFERYMSQPCTPFDMFMKGDKKAISDAAKRGKKLFEGKANCIECHNSPLTSDEKYYNIALPNPVEWYENGINQITFRFELYAKGVPEKFYREWKSDPGLYFREKRLEDAGKFRTAQLRFLNYSAPYMHNGVFFTLEEVVDFYNDGGGKDDPWNTKTKILKPLKLSDGEKADLVEFLLTLSGGDMKLPIPKIPSIKAFVDWQPKK
jgi:cytochrome c peroxidase